MATRQKFHLEILDPEYSRFVKDQVLTDIQLNEIIDFFEEQNRLTRTRLIGTGIACGLTLQSDGKTVTLGQGVAVTTDGDLLSSQKLTFTHFVEYSPPEECHYEPFWPDAGGRGKMITLFRLLTSADHDAITKKASVKTWEIELLSSKIPDWEGLLYLEHYQKKPVKCTPVSCDNLGSRQVSKPLVLAVSKAEMEQIIAGDAGRNQGDTIYSDYSLSEDEYIGLPEIRARRIVLTPAMARSPKTLGGAYIAAMKEGSRPLCQAITGLYQAFRFLLDREENLPVQPMTSRLFEILTTPPDLLQVQYTWDFYKDVVCTYNECREQFHRIACECQPDLYAFPKHIMLGEPNVEPEPGHPGHRHIWYPSPVTSQNDEALKKAASLLKRLLMMIECFRPAVSKEIKITPTFDYDRKLGKRAIPAYYPFFPKMARDWNDQMSGRGKELTIYGYHNDRNGDPLDYNTDRYDFFRIEGHIGMNIRTALARLQEIRKGKGVPVEFVAIRLGNPKLTDIDLDDFICRFEDLEVMLKAFQSEIACLVSETSGFFSGFTPVAEKPHVSIVKDMTAAGEAKWTLAGALTNRPVEPVTARIILNRTEQPHLEKIVTPREALLTSLCDRIREPYFRLDRVVKEALDPTPEAFGKYYAKVLEEKSLSVDEFVEKSRLLAAADPEYQKLSADQRFVLFEYPARIVGYLENIQRFIPGKASEVNEKNIEDYGKLAAEFCERLKTMRSKLERYFKTMTLLPGIEDKYLAMLEKTTRICCSREKLEVIAAEISKRKIEILSQLTLANFCQRHPGLEHKAGVGRGGTFVLVYSSGTTLRPAVEGVVTAGTARTLTATKSPEEAEWRDKDFVAAWLVENETEIDKEAYLHKYLEANKINPSGSLARVAVRELNDKIESIREILCRDIRTPEKEVIIGDFCLPYLCAADCPPVAYVLEKEVRVETPVEPKPDEPKPDEPKPDEPKPDEPKPDEPKPDEPIPDEPQPGLASCRKLVIDFLAEKSKFLENPTVQRRIVSSGSRELAEIAARTRDVLKRSEEAVKSGDAQARIQILEVTVETLNTLYKLQLTAGRAPVAQQVAVEMIRILHLLFLHLFRCDRKITAQIVELTTKHMELFRKLSPQLKEKYPTLNQGEVLLNSVTEYYSQFASQDERIKGLLERFIELLKTFPA